MKESYKVMDRAEEGAKKGKRERKRGNRNKGEEVNRIDETWKGESEEFYPRV